MTRTETNNRNRHREKRQVAECSVVAEMKVIRKVLVSVVMDSALLVVDNAWLDMDCARWCELSLYD